jgi:hypothetical protein
MKLVVSDQTLLEMAHLMRITVTTAVLHLGNQLNKIGETQFFGEI